VSPRSICVDRFAGKVALVTGGAHGIGRGMAERLHAEGAAIVIGDRDDAAGAQVASVLDARRPGSAHFVHADVSDLEQVRALVAATLQRFGRLDVLMANAGIHQVEPFLAEDDATWREILGVNLTGAYYCVREAARAMPTGGSIVVTASTNSFFMETEMAAYNVSKAGVAGLVRTAALDLAPRGIRINAVAPGLIRTRMTTGVTENPAHAAAYLQTIPLARFGEPADVAAAAGFLASDDADWITGALLVVDGGQTLGSNAPAGGGV
jgi:meso-butanediol dehydrogenase/(S,S)-butanediol dehydrogenase/diacetyl reductase